MQGISPFPTTFVLARVEDCDPDTEHALVRSQQHVSFKAFIWYDVFACI